jgi:hypothetical protein
MANKAPHTWKNTAARTWLDGAMTHLADEIRRVGRGDIDMIVELAEIDLYRGALDLIARGSVTGADAQELARLALLADEAEKHVAPRIVEPDPYDV